MSTVDKPSQQHLADTIDLQGYSTDHKDKMYMNDIEKKARALLAQAHREDTPKSQKAKCLESGTIHPADVPAIRAIIAALLESEGCKSS